MLESNVNSGDGPEYTENRWTLDSTMCRQVCMYIYRLVKRAGLGQVTLYRRGRGKGSGSTAACCTGTNVAPSWVIVQGCQTFFLGWGEGGGRQPSCLTLSSVSAPFQLFARRQQREGERERERDRQHRHQHGPHFFRCLTAGIPLHAQLHIYKYIYIYFFKKIYLEYPLCSFTRIVFSHVFLIIAKFGCLRGQLGKRANRLCIKRHERKLFW